MIRDDERYEEVAMGWHELRRETIPSRDRWERRAGQWRAVELARAVFGDEARGRLEGFPPRGGFRGLLELEVPFASLDEHRELEGIFLRLAGEDPVLERVPLVFAFVPVPEWADAPARTKRGARR